MFIHEIDYEHMNTENIFILKNERTIVPTKLARQRGISSKNTPNTHLPLITWELTASGRGVGPVTELSACSDDWSSFFISFKSFRWIFYNFHIAENYRLQTLSLVLSRKSGAWAFYTIFSYFLYMSFRRKVAVVHLRATLLGFCRWFEVFWIFYFMTQTILSVQY